MQNTFICSINLELENKDHTFSTNEKVDPLAGSRERRKDKLLRKDHEEQDFQPAINLTNFRLSRRFYKGINKNKSNVELLWREKLHNLPDSTKQKLHNISTEITVPSTLNPAASTDPYISSQEYNLTLNQSMKNNELAKNDINVTNDHNDNEKGDSKKLYSIVNRASTQVSCNKIDLYRLMILLSRKGMQLKLHQESL